MKKISFYCISLRKREDRWLNAKAEFQKANIHVEKFVALECLKYPIYGCALSHRALIEKSRKAGDEILGIFEDDIFFYKSKTFETDLQRILSELPADWHIVYFGGLLGRDGKLKKVSNSVYRVENLMCTYGILYNVRSFEKILSAIPNIKPESISDIEQTFVSGYKHFDEWLAKEYQLKYPCFISRNFLVGERSDYSDIEKSQKNMAKKYKIRFILYRLGLGFIFQIIGYLGDKFKISHKYKARHISF